MLHKLLTSLLSWSINSNQAFISDTSFLSASLDLVILAIEDIYKLVTFLLPGGPAHVLLNLRLAVAILISPPASLFDTVLRFLEVFECYLFQPHAATPLFFLAG